LGQVFFLVGGGDRESFSPIRRKEFLTFQGGTLGRKEDLGGKGGGEEGKGRSFATLKDKKGVEGVPV